MFSKTSVRSVLLASACILLLVLPAMAALDGFIFVQGARQGAFKGSLKTQRQGSQPRDRGK